ncbi:glycosyltransferase family protein [Cryobacterium tepidiphilum]|uniref:glycosyltransferase family 4 protein n=1 Tax=Cryobacterium tepidiphilum TaxID=2486026 RepID=UPI0011CE705C|nr:glycosyltransferase family 4 protein [Cryobacterium tepidiphilum]
MGDTTSTSLLIAENDVRGHRLYYVQILANAALKRGSDVTIALRADQARLPEIELHLGKVMSGVTMLYLDAINLDVLVEKSRELGSSLTVVPDGDGYVRSLVRQGRWRGSGSFSLLIMREGATRTSSRLSRTLVSWVKHGLYFYLHQMRRVNVVILRSALWHGNSYFSIAKDPVTLKTSPAAASTIRSEWGLDDRRYWFAVLGAVTSRKNVALVAEALLSVRSKQIGLLIAGKCDRSVRDAEELLQKLRSAGCTVIVQDRLLSDEDLDTAVAIVDCLVLAHSNEGPSGLFGKAAAAGTRVVCAGAKSLRRDTKAAGEMASWSELRSDVLGKHLEHAAYAPRPHAVAETGFAPFVRPLLQVESREA